MATIQADVAGLSELGASCAHHAAQLSRRRGLAGWGVVSGVVGRSGGGDADADATDPFASRMLSTGYTVVQAAADYAAADASNASSIGDVINDIADAVMTAVKT